MSNKDVIIGFAIGLGIGAVIGLLYAPRSGEETRQLLKERSSGFMKRLRHNLHWMLMTQRERYLTLWNHGGSLRQWRKGQEARNQG